MAARRTRIKGIASIPQRRKATIAVTEVEETFQLGPQSDETYDKKEHNLNSVHEIPREPHVAASGPISDSHEKDTFGVESAKNELEQNTRVAAAEVEAIPQVGLKTDETVCRLEPNEESRCEFSESCSTTLQLDKVEAENELQQITPIESEQDKIEEGPVIPVQPQPEQNLQSAEIQIELQQNTQNAGIVNQSEIQQNTKSEQKSLPQRSNGLFSRRFIKPSLSSNGLKRKVKCAELNPPRNNKIFILNQIISSPNSDTPLVINQYNQRLEEKHDETVDPVIQSPRVEDKTVEEPIENTIEKSFTEQLIPPPSPSKLNRTRIKAVPRLGQRHTSFSASESEDESRRNSRHRNDSICSTTSGLQDTNSNLECLSPQKPREFNTLIQRKCRRTEQSRKLAEARRDFYLKFGNQKPDREKLTMIDFIFYNPTTNLMSDSKPKKENKENKEEVVQKILEEEENEKTENDAVDNTEKQASDEENEMPAPQIKIGPDGEIIIDEQSLVVENKAVKRSREELEKQKVVHADLDTGYGIYKRAKRSKDWNKTETLKFYKALNTIGTDFTLMCELFPRRSRRELKLKFKKEEKINKALIDRAIMKPCDFDFNDFKNEVEIEEQELKEVEKQKQRELQIKKDTKKRKLSNGKTEVKEKISKTEIVKPILKKKKPFDIMSVLDDDSDADASDSASDSLDNFEKDTLILEAMKKPTRSGRVPRILKRYQSNVYEEAKTAPTPELGSLVVVAETGSNGESVYKVCMVTGDDANCEQVGGMPALNNPVPSLTSQENGCLESIFTLTTTRLDDIDETMPDILEEQNVTIPADETITADISDA